MTEKAYWFVAAVFREIDDLAATLAKLRAHDLLGEGILVLAAQLGDLPKKLNHSGTGDIAIATIDRVSGGWQYGASPEAELGCGLRKLLEAAQSAGVTDGNDKSSPASDGKGRVYAQLRQDADDGSNILVASVASPAEQLSVARILLRQKCERVLTHEIAVPAC